MNYTVTVYVDNVIQETQYFESHFKARFAQLELRKKYPAARIEIDEV